MKIKYFFMALCALLIASCSNEEIDTWSGKGYAWFPQKNVDFTFKSTPEIAFGESYLVGVPFTTATTVEKYDREVGVEIVRNASDSRTKYELQKPVLFHSNHVVDTVWVKVYNSEHLNTVHDTISLKIVPNQNFDPGLEEKITTNLCLYNGYARPAWWNGDEANHYMGFFTQLKMQIYWDVFGNDEDPKAGEDYWKGNMAVTYALQLLNDYVKNNDIRYPEDDENAPGKQPKFGWDSY